MLDPGRQRWVISGNAQERQQRPGLLASRGETGHQGRWKTVVQEIGIGQRLQPRQGSRPAQRHAQPASDKAPARWDRPPAGAGQP